MEKTNAVLTVDRSVIRNNVSVLAERQARQVDLMGVIKADAYGHGAVEVARALETKVQAFAVNDIQEAVALRKADIQKPVLVFGVPEPSTAEAYREFEITATVSAEEHFEMLPSQTSYHLNFDTGMRRFGFYPHQTEKVIQWVRKHNELTCTGIYTHFATADEPESEMVDRQQQLFAEVRKQFPATIKAHVSNTGGTAFYQFPYEMVRLGIGMYGYSPGKEEIEGIRPALYWKTRLVAVRSVQEGDSVSYGATWKAPSDGYLGVIPVGYEDGVRRDLSGMLSVRIGSASYELAGTITMNYCMIYLGKDSYEVGTEVEILYPASNASHWARKAGTIPYEVLTSINRKLPRIYTG